MIFVVVVLFAMSAMFSAVSNKDVFAPSKLFLVFFLAFHVGALFSDIDTRTATLLTVVLSVGALAVFFEADRVHRFRPKLNDTGGQEAQGGIKDATLLLWIASTPSLAAQFYMIDHFGGIAGYVASLSSRVSDWAGLGAARALIALMGPINLLYFALGLSQRKGFQWWAIYALHFFVVLGIGIMSGSRSSLLNIFALQIIVFHYLRTPIKPRQAVLIAGGLLLAAMSLGVVRETVRLDSGGTLTTNTSDRTLSFASFYYGVEPLEIISKTEYLPLAHGTTFLSLITNPIPRSIWPDKPDTGGTFFTKSYTNDAWGGLSNLTPTYIGEWIINFGWIGGIIGFCVTYFTMMIYLIHYYIRTMTRLNHDTSDVTVTGFVIYVYVAWSFMALMTGEFTNIILSMLLFQIIPLWLLREVLSRR
ncbi:O-antigen polymerase [Allosphingosinicella vermicomposti]|uniref:O-antigen polymerase n=1 Tax=Allosphingosinicella vermicomposti TaxID=614671 RepID=UPI000D0EA94A|nr:O-antigen polymerase [Allosphingosinicella vermicomposti]